MAADAVAEQALPIDIAYNKLADWLVDRKKVPPDWRKKLATLHARVAAALSALPRSVDPAFLHLTADCTGYLEAKHIRDVLLSTLPDSRNLFGRPAGAAGEWDAIVAAYEKDFIFLGEAAQIMVQNTNYEIPYQKKQIAKLHQQLSDLERKESELKSSAVQSAVKYQQACQDLGVPGVNIRAELQGLSKTLPTIFGDVVDGLCGGTIGSALEYYRAFISYAHSVSGDDPSSVLPTLTELRNHPPDVHTDLKPVSLFLNTQSDSKTDNDVYTTEIDWGVETEDMGKSMPSDIDWDIGPLEELDVEDSGVSISTELSSHPDAQADLNPIPSVSESPPDHQPAGQSVYQADVDTTEIDWGLETGDAETSIPVDIDWDIGTVDVKDNSVSDTGQEPMPGMSQPLELPAGIVWDIEVKEDGLVLPARDRGVGVKDAFVEDVKQGDVGPPSWFAEADNRSRLLDDLFELKAFLKQRLQEVESEETAALQNQVQAGTLSSVPQHGSDSLVAMASSVTQVLNLVTNRKTRDLILISTSIRYLNRLEASLTHKQQNERKLHKSIEDLGSKRGELRNDQALLWPKQEALVARTQSVKELVERTLSAQYNGRKVNIIGEINTLLGHM